MHVSEDALIAGECSAHDQEQANAGGQGRLSAAGGSPMVPERYSHPKLVRAFLVLPFMLYAHAQGHHDSALKTCTAFSAS